jgi:hypothetical protein
VYKDKINVENLWPKHREREGGREGEREGEREREREKM